MSGCGCGGGGLEQPLASGCSCGGGCGGQNATVLHLPHSGPRQALLAGGEGGRILLIAGDSRPMGHSVQVVPALSSVTTPVCGTVGKSAAVAEGRRGAQIMAPVSDLGPARSVGEFPLRSRTDATAPPPAAPLTPSAVTRLGVPSVKSRTSSAYVEAKASVARLPAEWQLLASGVDVVGNGWLRDALLAGERVVSTSAGGCLIRPSGIRMVAGAQRRTAVKAAAPAERPCTFVQRSVSSYDVASLNDVCGINLGPARYFSGAPFFGDLFASLPSGFTASSSHDEFLAFALPTWFSRIHASTPEAWDAASSALNPSIWDGVHPEWKKKGLYWQNSEAFLARALRYALVNAFAFAWATESIPAFSAACRIDRDVLRKTVSGDARDPSTNERWLLDVARVCYYSEDRINISVLRRVQPRRRWNGLWVGITPRFWTTLNDGVHVSAALADYHFSWAIRLFDYARLGHSENAIADLWMSICCARAGMAEIVDIAGLLVHEIAHTTNPFDSQQECRADSGRQECCRINLGWYFSHRVAAEFALPLAALPNMADDDEPESSLFPHETTLNATRNRFDFDADEYWRFTYDNGTATNTEFCVPAELEGTHHGLWKLDHALAVAWNYPDGCAAGGNSGQMLLNA